jgi:hypothetical protein
MMLNEYFSNLEEKQSNNGNADGGDGDDSGIWI